MIRRAVGTVLSGFSTRRIITIVALIASWCALWGNVSAANLLSGVLMAVVVTATGLSSGLSGGVRPIPLARLLWLVHVDLVRSTIRVIREIVTVGDHTSESIVAVTVPSAARRHRLLYTAAITLTPGTVVVDTDIDAGILFIHLLHDHDPDATTAHVERLAELASRAFPVAEETKDPSGDGS